MQGSCRLSLESLLTEVRHTHAHTVCRWQASKVTLFKGAWDVWSALWEDCKGVWEACYSCHVLSSWLNVISRPQEEGWWLCSSFMDFYLQESFHIFVFAFQVKQRGTKWKVDRTKPEKAGGTGIRITHTHAAYRFKSSFIKSQAYLIRAQTWHFVQKGRGRLCILRVTLPSDAISVSFNGLKAKNWQCLPGNHSLKDFLIRVYLVGKCKID